MINDMSQKKSVYISWGVGGFKYYVVKKKQGGGVRTLFPLSRIVMFRDECNKVIYHTDIL